MSAGCSLDDAFPDAVQKLPKKKRATKGPALSFLKGIDSDPDRPFTATIPKEGIKEGFTSDDSTVDVIGKSVLVQMGTPVDSYGHTVSSYFEKSGDENLSDYSPGLQDKTGYILNSDKTPGLATTGLPSANTNDAWKPLIRSSGIETAYISEPSPESGNMREEHEQLRKQIDMLFARLESMEHRRSEFSHSELGLFILTGLFIMFGMDTIRRYR